MNTRKAPRTGGTPSPKPLKVGLILLLIAALVVMTLTVANLNGKVKELNQTVTSQSATLEQQAKTQGENADTIKNQEETINDLNSRLKEKDKAIQSYEKKVQDMTSDYNKLLQTKKGTGGGTTAISKPAKKPVQYGTVAVTEKTCYLTFDDGPSDNTLKILDILDQYKVKATFFVMGTGKLSYVKKIHDAGHTVALHTYSHDYSKIYRSQKAYFEDLEKIGSEVKKYTGVDSKVIRFPGGSSNTVSRSYCNGIMTALSTETANRGYVYFDWNVDSTDASGNNVPVSKLVNSIKTYGGRNKQDVVLMHDTAAKDTTVQALPQIIEYYISKGYTFAPLTVQTPPVTHGINN